MCFDGINHDQLTKFEEKNPHSRGFLIYGRGPLKMVNYTSTATLDRTKLPMNNLNGQWKSDH